jgi:hypothetical protein
MREKEPKSGEHGTSVHIDVLGVSRTVRIIIPFKFQLQRNIFSKASHTMSAVPSFSFATTAEEVAPVFSQEIRGKNDTCVPCLAMKNELIKFASHRHGYISERDRF